LVEDIFYVNNNNESEIILAQDQALQTKYHVTKYYKQKRTANADPVNSLKRQQNASYQHA